MSGAELDRARRGTRAASGALNQRKTKPRPAPVSVRVNDAERAALDALAGDMAVSSYLKAFALKGDVGARKAQRQTHREVDRKLLAEILARLGASRMASNLNQIAKAAHLGVITVDADLERELVQACVDVAWMRTLLTEALGVRGSRKGGR